MKRKIFSFGFVFLLVFIFGSLFFPQITLATRNASAVISPTTAFVGENLTYIYTITNTNDGTTTAGIGSIEIQLPSEFGIPSVNILSASSNKTWVLVSSGGYVNGFDLSTGKIGIKADVGSGVDSDKLDVIEFVEIQITTTAPTTPNLYQWTAFVFANLNFTSDPSFVLTSSQPTLDVTTPITLSSIAITTPANKLNYTVGEELDITGLVVTGTYSDSSSKPEIITASNITGFDSSIPMTGQTLIVTVGEQITTYIINMSDTPPVLDYINIHLEVISGTDLPIYDDDISVIPCDSEGDGVMKATPYCALVQAPVANDYSGLWINSIAGLSNDFSDPTHYKSWTWLANLDFSHFDLSSKQYELQSNDQILFYFDTNPLKISDVNLSPEVGSEITVVIKKPDYTPWPPIWVSSPDAKIIIGFDTFDLDSNGEYKINILNTEPFVIKGHKDGFIDSPLINISPVALINNQENNNGGNGGGNSGDGSSIPAPTFSSSNALAFLFQNKENASIFINDWIAIAAGAGDSSSLKLSISDYLKSNPIYSSVVTDNERRAMALMALGINPYSGTNVNYIKKITDSFDGTQIGDSFLYNDDIFGLIVLSKAGYSKNDEIINNVVSHVVSKQSSDGSWGSVDMTAAGIEALSNFKNLDRVKDSISKGELYLKGEQKGNGGFDNSFSTSWAVQSLSLNNLYDFERDQAIKYLASLQQDDGGLEDSNINNRIWATSYAIPAVLKLPWSDILESFEKPVVESVGVNGGAVLSDEETVLPVSAIPTPILALNQNLDFVKKIEDKKVVEIPKTKINIKEPDVLTNSPSPTSEVSVNNNLGASAGNLIPREISVKNIFQTVINGVINVFTYIGKGFCDLIIFLFNF